MTTVSEPLRRLTRKDAPYQWRKEQDKAFNELNKRLANTETLGYFDLDAEARLITGRCQPCRPRCSLDTSTGW